MSHQRSVTDLQVVSASELAGILALTPARMCLLRVLEENGYLVRSGDGYDLAASVQGYVKFTSDAERASWRIAMQEAHDHVMAAVLSADFSAAGRQIMTSLADAMRAASGKQGEQ